MCGNLDFEYLPTATATAFVAAPCALHLQWPLGGWLGFGLAWHGGSRRHQSMTSLQRQVSAVMTEVEFSGVDQSPMS